MLTHLHRCLHACVRRFGDVEAAERDLLQLENARAIAAVQREAHRIAEKLDHSVAAEQTAALVAKAQADTVRSLLYCFPAAQHR